MAHYISTRDTHDNEIKVRLTGEDSDLIRLLARRAGIPVAVYARTLIKRGLGGGHMDGTVSASMSNGRG